MKIIATIDKDNVVVQCTNDEIAQILGYSSEYYMPDKPNQSYSKIPKVAVGDEIDINGMYQACQSVKGSAEQIEEAIKIHKRLISNMERFSAAITPAAEIIKSKEPKR